ncbi:outer membrane beta-barrel protein [Pseudoroseomonas globiformis]|uniref:Outer membrane beta-barrel protein n=1 Tax=Teichococcus globiformis TaxID=2307229 RepID=A0ABV7G2A5_9PROT
MRRTNATMTTKTAIRHLALTLPAMALLAPAAGFAQAPNQTPLNTAPTTQQIAPPGGVPALPGQPAATQIQTMESIAPAGGVTQTTQGIYPGGPGQTPQAITAQTTARSVTVQSRQRPDYDPAGVRIGGFRYDAALDLGMGWDDNLQPANAGKDSDAFFVQGVNLSAASTWTRHALGITASQQTRQYVQYNDQNWLDYSAGINGRYDIGRASSIGASYRRVHSHLATDNFDLQGEGIQRPIPYDSDIFTLNGVAAFNRLAIRPSATFSTIRYEEETINGQRTNNSNNDYDSLLGEVETEYSLVPGRSLLGLVRVQDINYTSEGQGGRDSFTWEVQGGFNYDLTGLWQARLLVGYRQRNYEDPSRKNLEGLAFEGQLVWLPSQLTTVTLAASRTIEESIRQSSVSYTRTAGGVTVDHELLRNVILTGEIRAEHRDYPDVGNVTDGIGLIGARYLINRNLSLIADYQHTERLSAPSGFREYGINQVQVRLRIAL